MTDSRIEIMARAIHDSFTGDRELFAWVDKSDPRGCCTIDGDVNLIKATKTAIAALEANGFVIVKAEPTDTMIDAAGREWSLPDQIRAAIAAGNKP